MKYKVKCYGCNAEYELEIGNVEGLRKQYCHFCQTVGRLKIEDNDGKDESEEDEPLFGSHLKEAKEAVKLLFRKKKSLKIDENFVENRRKEIFEMVSANPKDGTISILGQLFSPVDAYELNRRIQDALFDVKTKIILMGGSPDGK